MRTHTLLSASCFLQPGFTLEADALAFMRFPPAFCCAIAAEIIAVDAVTAEDGAALTTFAVASSASGEYSGSSVAPSIIESANGGSPMDMLAAVMVRTNVTAKEVTRVSQHLVWLLWRDVLLLYDSLARRSPYAGGSTAGSIFSSPNRGGGVASSAGANETLIGSPAGGRFSFVAPPKSSLASPAGVPSSQSTFVTSRMASVNATGLVERGNEKADLARGGYDRRTLDVHAAMVIYRILEATAAAHVFPLG